MTPEKRVAFAILLCAAIIGAGVMLRDAHVTGAASFGTQDYTTQIAGSPKQVILVLVDGMQNNHYVTMLNFGNLSNFTRLMSRGGFNTTLNITKHTSTVTAPGNAEIYTGLGSAITGVTSDNCSTPVPVNTTIFERLKQFNASVATGSVYGKQTCYIPNGVLGNAMPAIDWFQNGTSYNYTTWPDGTVCAYARNASTKAQEFLVNNTNRSFFLVTYFGNPDCSGHAATDNSVNYNNSFIEVDYALGILLDTLRDQGIENNTAIIISTDHGWNEGTAGHSTFNADTAIIPLITNNQSVIANATILGVRQQCDIAPTVLSYFGIPSANYSDIIANGCYSMYDSLFGTIDGCASINTSTALSQNIQGNGTCIVINADNVELNCAGKSIGFDAAGVDNATGISASGRTNVTIRDCVIRDLNESGQIGVGINLSNTNGSVIVNVSIQTNGTAFDYGIVLEDAAQNVVENNTIRTQGSSSDNNAFFLARAFANNITSNTLSTNGTSSNMGVRMQNRSNNNTVANNIISTRGDGASNQGIDLTINVSGNRIVNNRITANGSSSQSGIILATLAHNNTIANNTILADSVGGFTHGITVFSSSSENLFANNTLAVMSSSDNSGVEVLLSSNRNSFFLTTISVSNSYGVAITSSNASVFNATVFANVTQWISAGANTFTNFTNTTFATPNGSIAIPPTFQLNGFQDVNKAFLNVTFNRAFLNSSNLTFLNTTGIVTLYGLSLSDPKPQVDLADSGTFTDCTATADPFCTELSYSNGVFVFNVSHFTTFASLEGADVSVSLAKSDSPDPVNASNYLTYTITVNVSAGNASNVTLTDIYPPQVIFNGSQPSPLGGTNNTFILGNLTNGTSFAVNITVLVLNVSNNTVINNTANISFQNTTGGILALSVTENTTVVNRSFPAPSPSPIIISGGSGGGGGFSVRRNAEQQQAAAQTCVEGWACEGWSRCEDGMQSRECVDLNHCGTTLLKPAIEQACASPAPAEPVTEQPAEAPEVPAPVAEPQQPITLPSFGQQTAVASTLAFVHGPVLWIALFVVLFAILITIIYTRFAHRVPEAPEPEVPLPGREEPQPAPELGGRLTLEPPVAEEPEPVAIAPEPEPEPVRAMPPEPRVQGSREELAQVEKRLAQIESSLSRGKRASVKRSSAPRRRTRK